MRSKLILLTTAFALSSFMATAQDNALENFTGIRVEGNYAVSLKNGPSSVNTKGDTEGTNITVQNGILVISGKPKGDKLFNIDVTAPVINNVSMFGTGTIKSLDTLRADDLEIESSGTGNINLLVVADELLTSNRGTGNITLKGRANEHVISSIGTGDINASQLITRNTEVMAKGTGDIRVFASNKLSGSISGTGDVISANQPAEISIESTGPGTTITGDQPAAGDTTRLKLGEYKVTIVDENNKEANENKDDKKKVDNTHWAGLDLGFNGYLNSNHGLSMHSGSEFLALNHPKSLMVGLNLIEKDFRLIGDYVKLVTGLGFEWNSYKFDQNVVLLPSTPMVSGYIDSVNNFSKSKLKTSYIQVPLLLQFNTSRNVKKSFHFAMGVVGGYNLSTHQKLKYELNGAEVKMKIKDDFDVNPFKAAATVRTGYGKFNVFASYNLIPLFSNQAGPELYPYSIGITVLGL